MYSYSYYSTFIVAILLDMTSQMLYCTLPMYTTMHAFQFFQRKTLYINCVHNRIFPKIGGGNALLAPNTFFGGPWPPWPPVADPMVWTEWTPVHSVQTSLD